LRPEKIPSVFRLARELYRQVIEHGEYDEDRWLETYIRLMRDPDWNKDTYVEEIHRAFFTNYARGKAPRDCGIDDHHIGGLAQVPALVAALAHIGDDGLDRMRALVQRHIELTHKNQAMIDAATSSCASSIDSPPATILPPPSNRKSGSNFPSINSTTSPGLPTEKSSAK
jgi:ADP-ribosylglycohydrolase